MRKIIIFGNSGSGKTTLAKKLSARYALAHLDLDMLAWKKGEPPKRNLVSDSEKAINKFLEMNKKWVIEGCYADLLALVVEKADKIIFLNPGVEQCVSNCKLRPWEPHKYPTQKAQDENLQMLIEWVKQYPDRKDEFSLIAHRQLFTQFSGEKVEYQSNVEFN